MIGLLGLAGSMFCAAIIAWSASRRWSGGELLGVACIVGPLTFGWLVFVVSLALPLSSATVLGVAVALLVIGGSLGRRLARPLPWSLPTFRELAPVVTVAALTLLGSSVLRESWVEGADGTITTGTANNLGDVVFHVGLAHAFVFGQNFPPDSIHFAGRPLAYSFVPDVTTAALIAGGWSTGSALWIPASLGLLGLLALVACLTWRATDSAVAATLSAPLLLLAGGLHRLGDVPDWLSGEKIDWLAPPVAEAAWKNPFLSLLVTQRSTLAGLGVIAVVALMAWLAFGSGEAVVEPQRRRLLIGLGVLSGLLPLVFAHGFLALALVLPTLLFVCGPRDRVSWLLVGVPAAALALPQVAYLLTAGGASFIRWHPGWMSGGEDGFSAIGFVRFWLLELGFFVPLAILGLVIPGAAQRRRAFWATWWIPFGLASWVAVAPWIWDNTKLFVIWFALSVVVVASVLARAARHTFWGTGLSVAVLALSVLPGARDLGYAVFVERDFEEYDAAATAAASRLRELTPSGAVFLEHPHWAQLAFLVGRRSFMGYPGHLWSHGLDYQAREEGLTAFYRSVANGSAVERDRAWSFLSESGIDYVVLGPRERQAYGVTASDAEGWLATAYQADGLAVFDVRASTPRGRAEEGVQ